MENDAMNMLTIISKYLVKIPGLNFHYKPGYNIQPIYLIKDGYILEVIPLDIGQMVKDGWTKL